MATWTASDNAQLSVVEYKADTSRRASTAYVLLHGIESHAGWFDRLAESFTAQQADVYCMDRRGSGLNRDSAGFPSGHAISFRRLLEDLDEYCARLQKSYQQVVVIGFSWGAKLALAQALQGTSPVTAVVLVTPGFCPKVSFPLSTRLKILWSAYARPRKHFPIPIETDMFTTTPRWLQFIREDALRLESVSAAFYRESLRLDRFLKNQSPLQGLRARVFLAGHDRIINNAATIDYVKALGLDDRDVCTYDDQTHSIQLDAPDRLAADVGQWLLHGQVN